MAVWLLWLSTTVHLQRACVVLDSSYLPLCTARSEAERVQDLRHRLSSEPGDSSAWVALTSLERGPQEQALLQAAFKLAPNEPNVLMWRAGDALSRNDFASAIKLLVELVEYRGSGQATETLARIVATGQGTALLRPYLPTARRWLPQVLASLTALKLPVTSAMPLLVEASTAGTATKQTMQSYIRDLKSGGQWVDAYSLWVSQQRRATPLLHNGKFDEPFESDGFDWEITPALPSHAGAVVSQRGAGNRGGVLDIRFTGKPLAVPMIRQYVFLAPGNYVLRGQYMSSRLRTEQGLSWVVRCVNPSAPKPLAGQSEGLQDTSGRWRGFQFAFSVTHHCGPVVSLQLETFSAFEATAGMKGSAAFDGFELLPHGV